MKHLTPSSQRLVLAYVELVEFREASARVIEAGGPLAELADRQLTILEDRYDDARVYRHSGPMHLTRPELDAADDEIRRRRAMRLERVRKQKQLKRDREAMQIIFASPVMA